MNEKKLKEMAEKIIEESYEGTLSPDAIPSDLETARNLMNYFIYLVQAGAAHVLAEALPLMRDAAKHTFIFDEFIKKYGEEG